MFGDLAAMGRAQMMHREGATILSESMDANLAEGAILRISVVD
jgi:hypothetical protein